MIMSLNDVLTNVDLLENIFEHSDYPQNYRNALVSKAWSNAALGVLWRNLDSFEPLLSLLSPMTVISREGKAEYRYKRLIRPEDWIVFQRYSWRVRELRHMDHDYNFSDSMVMNIIMIKRALSGGELLPNLRHFRTDTRLLKWIPLFVHKRVSSLALVEGRADEDVFMQTVSYLPDLCPSLQNLTLLVNTVPSVALDSVFASLPLLKKVEISTSALLLAALNALARLPHLESLSIVADIDDDNKGFELPIMSLPDAFPSLTAFSSEKISFCLIASFLDAYRPRALRSLSVVSPNHEPYESCCSLCDAVVSTAPDMDKIYMYCGLRFYEADAFSIPLFPSVPHRRLNITSLELPVPLPLDVGGLRTLLTSLPSLVTLRLSDRAGPPTIPLFAFSELAPLCPAMRHLTLHLDTKALPASAPPHQTFQRLQVLNIGRSPLQSLARDVAAFLGAVLPPMCVLCHSHLDPKEGAKWEPVAEFLPLMQELQAARKALAATLPAQ